MGNVDRVHRVDPAVNAPNLLGRVIPQKDQKQHQQHEQAPKEDVVELHETSEDGDAIEHPSTPVDPDHGSIDYSV